MFQPFVAKVAEKKTYYGTQTDLIDSMDQIDKIIFRKGSVVWLQPDHLQRSVSHSATGSRATAFQNADRDEGKKQHHLTINQYHTTLAYWHHFIRCSSLHLISCRVMNLGYIWPTNSWFEHLVLDLSKGYASSVLQDTGQKGRGYLIQAAESGYRFFLGSIAGGRWPLNYLGICRWPLWACRSPFWACRWLNRCWTWWHHPESVGDYHCCPNDQICRWPLPDLEIQEFVFCQLT